MIEFHQVIDKHGFDKHGLYLVLTIDMVLTNIILKTLVLKNIVGLGKYDCKKLGLEKHGLDMVLILFWNYLLAVLDWFSILLPILLNFWPIHP